MFPPFRRWVLSSVIAVSLVFIAFNIIVQPMGSDDHIVHSQELRSKQIYRLVHPGFLRPKFQWRNVRQKHPVDSFTAPPTGPPAAIPKIQPAFDVENPQRAAERKRRLRAVKDAFIHSWEGYKQNAWLQDEVSPLTGSSSNAFGGWGATLVDSLDSLLIMDMKDEFLSAVSGLRKIDFNTSPVSELNVFETTIRYLGGLLSAYDISEQKHKILLDKATELGDMLYHAFDTPNRMPITRWNWESSALGIEQEANRRSLLAEVGSLSLEFTRLSQLTGNPKYYDAISRVTNVFFESQNKTKIPGLWPVFVDATTAEFTKDTTFSIGGMADSLYEYLPKQHILLGGRTDQYQQLYLTAFPAIKKHLFFQPLNPDNRQMLMPGTVKRYSSTKIKLQPHGEHLGCFAGGMVALAAKIFQQPNDLETARDLVEGCVYAYESMPSGIAPETWSALPCHEDVRDNCTWREEDWQWAVVEKANHGSVPKAYVAEAQKIIKTNQLAPGFTEISDARFLLRPEAIESLFVLYRITGDTSLQDKAWNMFRAINDATKTNIGHAALKDVRQLGSEREFIDSMESFWTAETLKYFYLIFSEPDLISLDDYVLNTEAHPLLRPK